jgi:hypothetical protein
MTTFFQPGGPTRYAHQRRGLDRLISTGGVAALLFDPGLGKTATILDYASLLALLSRRRPGREDREARVLVVCPLVAVDTWVLQARTFVSPQVSYWAEAIGGSVLQRCEALASRGGRPFPPAAGKKAPDGDVRALHHGRAWAWEARTLDGRDVTRSGGPGALPGPRLVLEVVNIDTFSTRARLPNGTGTMADKVLESVRRFDPDLVVVDESHRIKAPMGNASRLLARVGRIVPRRVILTGTVMPHSPLDVFAQWRFLDPEAFGPARPDGSRAPATYSHFKSRFAVMGGFMGHEVVRFRNLDDLERTMALRAEVALKEDALDLPSTTDVIVPVHLSPGEQRAYREMKANLAAALAPDSGGGSVTVTSRLAQMMRLRQITAGHVKADDGAVRTVGHSKVRTIASLVQDTLAGEKRIVVFALFRHEVAALTQALDVAGTEVLVITGDTSQEARQAYRQRFGSSDPARLVMVAQVKTMSLAVNELVTASHAIFATLSHQRDDLVQARDRLHRIGQSRPTTFWYALAPGTVDEVVYQAHQDRTDLEAALLVHVLGEREQPSAPRQGSVR